jgi:hypothetical protein
VKVHCALHDVLTSYKICVHSQYTYNTTQHHVVGIVFLYYATCLLSFANYVTYTMYKMWGALTGHVMPMHGSYSQHHKVNVESRALVLTEWAPTFGSF